MSNPSHRLGDLERHILQRLWKRGNATVADVVGDLKSCHAVAYTTVLTVMNRLTEKGILSRSAEGRAFRYTPKYSKNEMARRASRSALRSLIRDYGPAAVAQFIDVLDDVDPRLIRELERSLKKHA